MITDEIDKFSDGFFGNSSNVKYFLSNNRFEVEGVISNPKPVLSGCDAHSFSDLEEKLGKFVCGSKGIEYEPTWIKSDLTFNGLKQIVFEPRNRVYIGKEPKILQRVREHSTKFIDSLHITSIDNYKEQHGVWFKDEQIKLGNELVAIIGNKGSGKSAITDIVGLLGNSHNQFLKSKSEELFSFLSKEKFRKKKIANNFRGDLIWSGGEVDSKSLYDDVDKNFPEKVEYLPQKYLERICSNIAEDEFRTTLNEVIFRYVEFEQRFGQTNLDNLIKFKTSELNQILQYKKSDLHQQNEKVVEIERKLTKDYFNEIKNKLSSKKEELREYEKTAPIAVPKPPDKSEESVSAANKKIQKLDTEIKEKSAEIERLRSERSDVTLLIEELRQVKVAIKREVERFQKLELDHQSTLSSAGLVFEDIVSLKVDFEKFNELVKEKNRRIDEIDDLLKTKEQIEEEFGKGDETKEKREQAELVSIVCCKVDLEHKRAKKVEKLDQPQRHYQDYLEACRIWNLRRDEINGDKDNPVLDTIRGLKNELENIRRRYPEEFKFAREKQKEIACQIFQLKLEFIEFYETIKQSIDSEIDKIS